MAFLLSLLLPMFTNAGFFRTRPPYIQVTQMTPDPVVAPPLDPNFCKIIYGGSEDEVGRRLETSGSDPGNGWPVAVPGGASAETYDGAIWDGHVYYIGQGTFSGTEGFIRKRRVSDGAIVATHSGAPLSPAISAALAVDGPNGYLYAEDNLDVNRFDLDLNLASGGLWPVTLGGAATTGIYPRGMEVLSDGGVVVAHGAGGAGGYGVTVLNIDGTQRWQTVWAATNGIAGVAVDEVNGFIYTIDTTDNEIQQLNIHTGARTTTGAFPFTIPGGWLDPRGIAADETHVYVVTRTFEHVYAYEHGNSMNEAWMKDYSAEGWFGLWSVEVRGDYVYVGVGVASPTAPPSVIKLEASTGTEAWRSAINGNTGMANTWLAIGDCQECAAQQVYGGGRGEVGRRLELDGTDPGNGWPVSVGSSPSTAYTNDGEIYNGHVYYIGQGTFTGTQQFIRKRRVSDGADVAVYFDGVLTSSSRALAVDGANGYVYADVGLVVHRWDLDLNVDASGSWPVTIPNATSAISTRGLVSVSDGGILVAHNVPANARGVTLLNIDGSVRWQASWSATSTTVGIAVDEDTGWVYHTDNNGVTQQIALVDGTRTTTGGWPYNLTGGMAAIAAGGGLVFTAHSGDASVRAWGPASGMSSVWVKSYSGVWFGMWSVEVRGDYVYAGGGLNNAGTDSPAIIKYEAATGTEVWQGAPHADNTMGVDWLAIGPCQECVTEQVYVVDGQYVRAHSLVDGDELGGGWPWDKTVSYNAYSIEAITAHPLGVLVLLNGADGRIVILSQDDASVVADTGDLTGSTGADWFWDAEWGAALVDPTDGSFVLVMIFDDGVDFYIGYHKFDKAGAYVTTGNWPVVQEWDFTTELDFYQYEMNNAGTIYVLWDGTTRHIAEIAQDGTVDRNSGETVLMALDQLFRFNERLGTLVTIEEQRSAMERIAERDAETIAELNEVAYALDDMKTLGESTLAFGVSVVHRKRPVVGDEELVLRNMFDGSIVWSLDEFDFGWVGPTGATSLRNAKADRAGSVVAADIFNGGLLESRLGLVDAISGTLLWEVVLNTSLGGWDLALGDGCSPIPPAKEYFYALDGATVRQYDVATGLERTVGNWPVNGATIAGAGWGSDIKVFEHPLGALFYIRSTTTAEGRLILLAEEDGSVIFDNGGNWSQTGADRNSNRYFSMPNGDIVSAMAAPSSTTEVHRWDRWGGLYGGSWPVTDTDLDSGFPGGIVQGPDGDWWGMYEDGGATPHIARIEADGTLSKLTLENYLGDDTDEWEYDGGNIYAFEDDRSSLEHFQAYDPTTGAAGNDATWALDDMTQTPGGYTEAAVGGVGAFRKRVAFGDDRVVLRNLTTGALIAELDESDLGMTPVGTVILNNVAAIPGGGFLVNYWDTGADNRVARVSAAGVVLWTRVLGYATSSGGVVMWK